MWHLTAGAVDPLVCAYRSNTNLLAVLLATPGSVERTVFALTRAGDDDIAAALGLDAAGSLDPRSALSAREREVYELVCPDSRTVTSPRVCSSLREPSRFTSITCSTSLVLGQGLHSPFKLCTSEYVRRHPAPLHRRGFGRAVAFGRPTTLRRRLHSWVRRSRRSSSTRCVGAQSCSSRRRVARPSDPSRASGKDPATYSKCVGPSPASAIRRGRTASTASSWLRSHPRCCVGRLLAAISSPVTSVTSLCVTSASSVASASSKSYPAVTVPSTSGIEQRRL